MSPTYERLSAQDMSFLMFEGLNKPMNIGGLSIFEDGRLANADGGIKIDRLRKHFAATLDAIPRYRQKLAYVPFFKHPIWVDDDHFDLTYHVRHTALPRPGSLAQLKALTARVLSAPLDLHKPLWETWI